MAMVPEDARGNLIIVDQTTAVARPFKVENGKIIPLYSGRPIKRILFQTVKIQMKCGICHLWQTLRHDTVISPYREGLIFTKSAKFREYKTLAKISEFTE